MVVTTGIRDGCEVGSRLQLRVCEARDHGTKSLSIAKKSPPRRTI